MTINQLDEWVKGNSLHDHERGECCPDFSCCQPDLQVPKKVREAFKAANDEQRMEFLMGFLAAALQKATKKSDKKVYLAGTAEREQ